MLEKEIRIRIKSILHEVEASLFSRPEIDDEPISLFEESELEPEILEINSMGILRIEDGENGRTEIRYDETEVTGMSGATTSVSFVNGQPGVVSMLREGSVSTALVFEEGKRHHCIYNTPIMPFEVCVHTLRVNNRLTEDGILDLDYIVEIRGAQAERTKFHLQLLQ